MKTRTTAFIAAAASIVFGAATFAADKPASDAVFNIKSDGKVVAVITLMDTNLQVMSTGGSRVSGPSKDNVTEATFTGKVTLQRKSDTHELIVINADEVQWSRKPVK